MNREFVSTGRILSGVTEVNIPGVGQKNSLKLIWITWVGINRLRHEFRGWILYQKSGLVECQ